MAAPPAAPPDAPSATPTRRFRWIALALILLSGLGVRALLPEALRRTAESEVSRALGRVVRIGDVDLALLAGRLEVEELAVLEPIGTVRPPDQLSDPPIISLRRGRANLHWTDLLARRIRLGELELEGATATFKRQRDGSIVPLVMADATPEAGPDEAPAEAPDGAPAEAPDEAPAESVGAEANRARPDPWPIVVDRLVLRQAQTILALEEDDSTQVVAVGVAELRVADFFLQGDDIRVGAVDFDRPDVSVIPDLLIVPAAPAESDGPAAVPLPGLVVERLAIDGATLTFRRGEDTLAIVVHAAAEQLKLPSPFPVDLRLDVGTEGAFVHAEGRARVFTPSFDGSLRWEGLDLARLQQASGLPLPVALETARTEGELEVAFSYEGENAPPALDVSGSLGLRELSSRILPEGPDVGAASLDLVLERATLETSDGDAEPGLRILAKGDVVLEGFRAEATDPQPADVAIERVEFESAEARVPLEAPTDSSLRMASLRIQSPTLRTTRIPKAEGAKAGSPEADPTAEPGARTDVSVGSFELVEGVFEWRDEAVSPVFETRIDPISIRAEDVGWKLSTARDMRAEARGPGTARTNLSGSVENRTGNLAVDLEGLDLALLRPYLADTPWGGVKSGSLELRTRAELDPEVIDTRNQLLLYQLGLGNSSPGFEDAVGVPLDLAVALLEKSDGSIRIEPRLRVERGTTNLQPLIRAALAAALEGAVAVPLKAVTGAGGKLIAALPGTGRPGEGVIAMRPGETEVPTAGVPSLAQLAEALSELPRFGVRVSGRAGPADDTAAPGADGLSGAALARARAERVTQLLVADYGVAPERIRLGEPLEGDPGVRLDLVRVDESTPPPRAEVP